MQQGDNTTAAEDEIIRRLAKLEAILEETIETMTSLVDQVAPNVEHLYFDTRVLAEADPQP